MFRNSFGVVLVLLSFECFAQFDCKKIEKQWVEQINFCGARAEIIRSTHADSLSSSSALKVPLTLVHIDYPELNQYSSWTRNQIIEKLDRTQSIYGQCNIKFSPVILITAEPHEAVPTDVEFETGDNTLLVSNIYPEDREFPSPVVYFAHNQVDRSYGGGVAWRRGITPDNLRNNTLYLNNAILFYIEGQSENVNNGEIQSENYDQFEMMAHELAHILLDQSHQTLSGTLMSYKMQRTNILTESQCKIIRKNIQENF
jgi:hypothetical protein